MQPLSEPACEFLPHLFGVFGLFIDRHKKKHLGEAKKKKLKKEKNEKKEKTNERTKNR